MNWWEFIVFGFVASLHNASIRGYKDSLWEKFEWIKFYRSVLFGIIGGVIAYWLYLEIKIQFKFVNLFLFSLGSAVLIVESYKWFFRLDDQSKYIIPTYFTWFGKVIERRWQRVIIGVIFSSFVMFLLWQLRQINFDYWFRGLMIGLIGGITTSGAGSFKDAPFEGFFIKKFWRSWWVDIIGGVIMAPVMPNNMVLLGMVWGWDRLWIEFYKCLWLRNEAPGKFKIKKIIYLGWQKKRNWLLIPYASSLMVPIAFSLLK